MLNVFPVYIFIVGFHSHPSFVAYILLICSLMLCVFFHHQPADKLSTGKGQGSVSY